MCTSSAGRSSSGRSTASSAPSSAQGITNALYTVNRRGFLKLVHLGDKHDPDAYKPVARTFRPLTDASYASDLPANLATRESLTAAPLFPHEVRGRGSRLWREPEGALPSMLDST